MEARRKICRELEADICSNVPTLDDIKVTSIRIGNGVKYMDVLIQPKPTLDHVVFSMDTKHQTAFWEFSVDSCELPGIVENRLLPTKHF
jgi:hypothetical protein